MIGVMSRTTGLSLVSIEEDCVHVLLQQEVPVAVRCTDGGCAVSPRSVLAGLQQSS